MRKIVSLITIIAISGLINISVGQEKINFQDKKGMKQGHWVTRYDNGNTRYEGDFVNNKPEGEFRRYYEDGTLAALLYYYPNADSVSAAIFHTNGYISGKGSYHNQAREGKWEFYSQYIKDYLVCMEYYSNDLREGRSLKYHWNGNIAEEITFAGDKQTGEWKQYYSDGVLALRGLYVNGKRNGPFETFTTEGLPMIRGNYSNDIRTGDWSFYNNDGSFRTTIRYINGVPENLNELEKKETDLLDEMEKRGGMIEDPAKTGFQW